MTPRISQIAQVGALLIALPQLASATERCVNPGGTAGCTSTISAAVAASVAGDIVKVSPGTYKESVTITKWIALYGAGDKNTIIDATGLPNGIFINGIGATPTAGVNNVTVSGFTIKNANFEGILVASATGVTIAHNHVTNNNLSLTPTTCPGIPAFETQEAMDCGEGVHLMGSDHTTVVGNVVDYNSGGVLITDETGPSHGNVITENLVTKNGYACGITMASHPPYFVIPLMKGTYFGVYENTVSKNESSYNGLNNGGGAGVGMFAPSPGAANYGNVAVGNLLLGNGQPGVAMHNHAAPPMAPPVTFRDNTIVGNTFRGNGGDPSVGGPTEPTGVNIFSMLPVIGMVVADNVFEDEAIGISLNSPATDYPVPQVQAHFNQFDPRSIGISTLGKATIDGNLNWWGCAEGPGVANCASTTPGVSFIPFLTRTPKDGERGW